MFLSLIRQRRSIRKYKSQPVEDEKLALLVEAALRSPSSMGNNPWEFIIVTDQDKKDQIKDVHPYVGMIQNAPLGILICGDISKEKFQGFWPQDCAAAMQNLLLAAHASGLGAVWTGIYPIEDRALKFKRIFNLPDHIIPFGLAVMGWPAQKIKSEERFTEELVRYNVW